jgi:uncharacterized repeat protein (TIGR03803 family)
MGILICASSIAAQSHPTLKTIHNFVGAPGDGAQPKSAVIIGKGKILYGTTLFGGSGLCSSPSGCGTVFALSPSTSSGGTWAETVVHNFADYPSDGWNPTAGVVIGSGDVLYGTTSSGGSLGYGTVYSLKPPEVPGDPWTESVIYSFKSAPDGVNPTSGIVIGNNGVLYGTTFSGGVAGYGTVFSLSPPPIPKQCFTISWAPPTVMAQVH